MDEIDWVDMLAVGAKARKKALDSAVRAALREVHAEGVGFRTHEVAAMLWPHRQEHPRTFDALCKTLVKMAPFFGRGICYQSADKNRFGRRPWLWQGQRYDAADKVREEIANDPGAWE